MTFTSLGHLLLLGDAGQGSSFGIWFRNLEQKILQLFIPSYVNEDIRTMIVYVRLVGYALTE